jgi:YHS domain-containing protein
MTTRAKLKIAIACLTLLGYAGTANAQSAEKKMSDSGSHEKTAMTESVSRAFTNGYNVPSSGVAMEGYCPVCYLAANKAVKGLPSITHDYKGVTYWFVNEGARQEFISNPEKYIPAYGGWCALGVAMGQRFPVDPTNFKIVDGRIMLFLKNANVDGAEIWNRDEANNLGKAEQNWKKLGS